MAHITKLLPERLSDLPKVTERFHNRPETRAQISRVLSIDFSCLYVSTALTLPLWAVPPALKPLFPSDHYSYLKTLLWKHKHQSKRMPWHLFFFPMRIFCTVVCEGSRLQQSRWRGGYQERTVAVEIMYVSKYVSRCKSCLVPLGLQEMYTPKYSGYR